MTDILKRLKDFENGNKRPLSGLFFNINQFRLELVFDSKTIAWISVEGVFHIGKLEENLRKKVVCEHYEPLRTMLMDFFYPGWTINHYVNTGRQAWRAF